MTTSIVRETLIQPGPAAVVVTDALTVVLGPVNLMSFDKKTFTVKNTGGTAFSACKVQATPIDSGGLPSETAADWEDIDTTSIGALAGGAVKSAQIKDDSRKWWRVVAQVAAGSTTAQGYLTAGAV
jgi:hypothetical protein